MTPPDHPSRESVEEALAFADNGICFYCGPDSTKVLAAEVRRLREVNAELVMALDDAMGPDCEWTEKRRAKCIEVLTKSREAGRV